VNSDGEEEVVQINQKCMSININIAIISGPT